jgi:hypothetical protein
VDGEVDGRHGSTLSRSRAGAKHAGGHASVIAATSGASATRGSALRIQPPISACSAPEPGSAPIACRYS